MVAATLSREEEDNKHAGEDLESERAVMSKDDEGADDDVVLTKESKKPSEAKPFKSKKKKDSDSDREGDVEKSSKKLTEEEEADLAWLKSKRGKAAGGEDAEAKSSKSKKSKDGDKDDVEIVEKGKKKLTEEEEADLAWLKSKRRNAGGEEASEAKLKPSAVEHVSEVKAWERRRAEKSKTGGVYIPPHKMKELAQTTQDKTSEKWQRMCWDALRKSINGLINKVNTGNIKNIVPEMFQENLVRGRGLVCRSIMKAQMASPTFTHVYAALIAIINTKMPEIGELLLKRVMMQFRRSYKRNDKLVCLACTKFLAHLVNQQVAHELVALQLMTLLLENPTDDSVEVAVDFVKECGMVMTELSPKGMHGIFERFRGILHEGEIDKRVQYMIEGLYKVRKSDFADYPGVLPELDLVNLDDQITHELSLEDNHDVEKLLDIFRVDPDWQANEDAYVEIKREILGEEEAGDDEDDGDDDDDSDSEEEEEKPMEIIDRSETDVILLRRQIYLTIMSALDFEECAHKLLKIEALKGNEKELCNMMLECCAQERTYMRFYGSLGERFCRLQRVYAEQFDECFATHYATIHRFETGKLRNIAKFFAHLLTTDAFDWAALSYIHLNEEDTTSCSRIFIKILFREMSEIMGMQKLKDRLEDPFMSENFLGLFPKDHAKNTRFSINFFTSIGLGGLTEGLREHLKNAPKAIKANFIADVLSDSESSEEESDSSSSSSSDSSSSSSSSDSSSSDSDSDSDSDSSGSDSDDDKKKKKKKGVIKTEVKPDPDAKSKKAKSNLSQDKHKEKRKEDFSNVKVKREEDQKWMMGVHPDRLKNIPVSAGKDKDKADGRGDRRKERSRSRERPSEKDRGREKEKERGREKDSERENRESRRSEKDSGREKDRGHKEKEKVRQSSREKEKATKTKRRDTSSDSESEREQRPRGEKRSERADRDDGRKKARRE